MWIVETKSKVSPQGVAGEVILFHYGLGWIPCWRLCVCSDRCQKPEICHSKGVILNRELFNISSDANCSQGVMVLIIA